MVETKLRKLITIFEDNTEPLSIHCLAKELDITPERVEGLVDFWVRKGRIKPSVGGSNCGSCGVIGDCPFVFDVAGMYELV